jgi:AGCS family alanine or glycine:cation symporter
MAHAGAEVACPTDQGLMGIVEVFLDTIVICTMTALVILCSGVPIPYGVDAGIGLTTAAFSSVLGDWVSILIAFSLCLFAFATVLGWGLYGIRCAQFLFPKGGWKYFVYFQIAAVALGTVVDTSSVWLAAEILNGLMAIPNLIALLALSGLLQRLTLQKTFGGYHESIHQCQSL